jgi:hypothetical protein
VLVTAVSPAASAQLAPIGVPKGMVRVELDGRMDIWDTEYRDGTRVGLGADLTNSGLGRAILPFLADADTRLERITGIAGYGLDLGRLATDVQRDESQGYLGLSLGLTRAITVFGRLPLVRARAQSSIALDPSTSGAGFNPGADESTFFTQLNGALSTLTTNINNGSYSGATLALAQATLTSGTELSDDLFAVLSDPTSSSPFVPTSASAAGAAILARVAALQTTLANNLGIPGFVQTPTLPADAVTRDEFIAFLNNTSGPVGLRTANTTVTFRGDAETGVALTLVDRWDRANRRGGLRAAVQGLVRYPTGNVPRADRLFLVGTGDGQTDIEGRATLDLGTGAIGVRLEGDYNRQLAADIETRVTAPSQPLNGLGFISVVRNDPGDARGPSVLPTGAQLRDPGNRAALVSRGRRGDVRDRSRFDPWRVGDRARDRHQGQRNRARPRHHLREFRAAAAGWVGIAGRGGMELPAGGERERRARGQQARIRGLAQGLLRAVLRREKRKEKRERRKEKGEKEEPLSSYLRFPFFLSCFSFLSSLFSFLSSLFSFLRLLLSRPRLTSEQGLRMATSGFAFGVAQHPRDLRDPVFAVDGLHVAGGETFARLLGHDEMAVGPRGDLRQMGDHQHLVPLRHLRQRITHPRPDLPPNALVHFIEYHRGDRVVARQYDLEREHQPGQLPAGGRACEWAGVESDIELHVEAHALLPPRPRLAELLERDEQLAARDAELG